MADASCSVSLGIGTLALYFELQAFGVAAAVDVVITPHIVVPSISTLLITGYSPVLSNFDLD